MIQASELRVNNSVISHKHNGLITAIHTIMPNGVRLWANPFAPCYKFDEISGIPLTEELLLKMGFVKAYSSNFTLRYEHPIEIQFDYKFNLVENVKHASWRGNHIKCDYVHRLQNLYFALCSQELTLS